MQAIAEQRVPLVISVFLDTPVMRVMQARLVLREIKKEPRAEQDKQGIPALLVMRVW
jgi:hypothetical protein